MEDDEEIQSHTENRDESRDSSHQYHPSNTVTVTVAAVATSPFTSPYHSTTTAAMVAISTHTPAASALTPALPIQQYSDARTSALKNTVGGGREDCWSEGATSVLIEAWGERFMELSRGNLKQKHWQEVADIVNSMNEPGKTLKTDVQCKNRIDTVKKKFKIEKSKVLAGSGPSRWLFYERMDGLIGPTALDSAGKGMGSGGGVSVSPVPTGINASQEALVPVGIPFGVRQQLPLPYPPYSSSNLQTPPHLQPQQAQPIRQCFPSPISQQPRFNHQNHNHVLSYGSNVSAGPVGNVGNSRQHQFINQPRQFRRAPPPVVGSESEEEGWSNVSGDSLPPEMGYDGTKRVRVGLNVGSGGVRKGKGKGKKEEVKVWGNSVRELTRAILKFGEAYETAESAKLEHIVEMEKQRMKFAKELELQRMKFLMKTQLELSQFSDRNLNGNGNSDRRGGSSSGGEKKDSE